VRKKILQQQTRHMGGKAKTLKNQKSQSRKGRERVPKGKGEEVQGGNLTCKTGIQILRM
jgi:hypothetical protein